MRLIDFSGASAHIQTIADVERGREFAGSSEYSGSQSGMLPSQEVGRNGRQGDHLTVLKPRGGPQPQRAPVDAHRSGQYHPEQPLCQPIHEPCQEAPNSATTVQDSWGYRESQYSRSQTAQLGTTGSEESYSAASDWVEENIQPDVSADYTVDESSENSSIGVDLERHPLPPTRSFYSHPRGTPPSRACSAGGGADPTDARLAMLRSRKPTNHVTDTRLLMLKRRPPSK
eukprot:SAG31_NODE_3645_length_4030_cov_2.443653_2_plen_229_part_00